MASVPNYAVLKGADHSIEVAPMLLTHFPKFTN